MLVRSMLWKVVISLRLIDPQTAHKVRWMQVNIRQWRTHTVNIQVHFVERSRNAAHNLFATPAVMELIFGRIVMCVRVCTDGVLTL
jgi:hypothetical protein